jgi:lactoylglutathione lyase
LETRLAYCGIRVTDLERSLRFYSEILGLRVLGRGRMKHGGKYVLLEDPKTKQRLELNWYPEGTEFYSKYNVGEGIDHLGFVVDDVNGTYKKLLSLGASPAAKPWKEIENDETSWVGFVKDPDGIWVELITQDPSVMSAKEVGAQAKG